MNQIKQMLNLMDKEYAAAVFYESCTIARKGVGRKITLTEQALITVSITYGLLVIINNNKFNSKKSKSLARASSLAVIRALALNIDEGKSTTYFRKQLGVTQNGIDKQVVNAIDNNLSDRSYFTSTSRALLLASTHFLEAINLDDWKYKLDIEIYQDNATALLENLAVILFNICASSHKPELYENHYSLLRAYSSYDKVSNDFGALFYIS